MVNMAKYFSAGVLKIIYLYKTYNWWYDNSGSQRDFTAVQKRGETMRHVKNLWDKYTILAFQSTFCRL